MIAYMMCDNRDTTGLCIVEEMDECFAPDEPMYKGTQKYWVMLVENDLWYPHGVFCTMQKAKKRLDLITNGEIECW